ncbi:Uncharacterized protein DAT39_019804 [Clarias magur]|uniref:Uncharacterized protein n=1 Tax=Clarias magur TaxID=1594786 RepID=A0A8J4XA88_CLAMG|nr:Uncharacterized protein DAT39_019804 [Clarias magur]
MMSRKQRLVTYVKHVCINTVQVQESLRGTPLCSRSLYSLLMTSRRLVSAMSCGILSWFGSGSPSRPGGLQRRRVGTLIFGTRARTPLVEKCQPGQQVLKLKPLEVLKDQVNRTVNSEAKWFVVKFLTSWFVSELDGIGNAEPPTMVLAGPMARLAVGTKDLSLKG